MSIIKTVEKYKVTIMEYKSRPSTLQHLSLGTRCVCVCVCMCACVCVYVCMYVCMYECMCRGVNNN